MTGVSTAEIKLLREMSSAGVLDCKKALEEASGDVAAAVRILRRMGAQDAAKRAGRIVSNGLVAAEMVDAATGIMLELRCETDFVAKNESFRRLATEVMAAAVRSGVADRLALLDADISAGTTVRERIEETGAAIKERLELGRLARLEGGYVACYLHKSDPSLPPTVGALVQLNRQDAELGRGLAQQIAAMRPTYTTRGDVPAEILDRQRRLSEQIARDEGKPERAVPKIVAGRLTSFLRAVVLAEQPYIRDPKRTVGELLAESGTTVWAFTHFKIGDGPAEAAADT
jgi:elongation factor Ts